MLKESKPALIDRGEVFTMLVKMIHKNDSSFRTGALKVLNDALADSSENCRASCGREGFESHFSVLCARKSGSNKISRRRRQQRRKHCIHSLCIYLSTWQTSITLDFFANSGKRVWENWPIDWTSHDKYLPGSKKLKRHSSAWRRDKEELYSYVWEGTILFATHRFGDRFDLLSWR